MNHAIDLAVGCHYFLPGLRLPPQLSADGATCKRQHTSDSSLLLIYRPRKDERLSWPSWLTSSGRFTHISGHPSAAGRAQDRESSPVRDRRSTTVPRHQPLSTEHDVFTSALSGHASSVIQAKNRKVLKLYICTCRPHTI